MSAFDFVTGFFVCAEKRIQFCVFGFLLGRDLNGEENVEWGLLLPGAPVAAQTPVDVVRASVPPDVLSALEQDLCGHDHGSRSPSARQQCRIHRFRKSGVWSDPTKNQCLPCVSRIDSRRWLSRRL